MWQLSSIHLQIWEKRSAWLGSDNAKADGHSTTTFMMIVGAPEIVAELIGPFKPSFGGYRLACGGIINLMQVIFSQLR